MAHRLDKAVVLYFPASLIGPEGANCGSCMMLLKDVSQCSILKPPGVKADGVCGLYVHGKPTSSDDHPPMKIVPKEIAGYIDDGPTRCGTCEYALDDAKRCAVVQGQIEPLGCCNHYERKAPGSPDVESHRYNFREYR